MIEVENLHAYYGNLNVLKGVSFQVKKGEIVVIIGPNGSGKSTLLKSIIGIILKKKGKILFNNIEITNMQTEEIILLGLVLVPERREIFPSFSVKENLDLGAYHRYRSRKENRKKIEESLDFAYDLFPVLRERQRQIAETMSGGEQQMLSIARALMSTPTAILLDEPSLGLSPILTIEIFNVIDRLRREGISILLIEQNAKMALNLADRGYVMRVGEIILNDSGKNLMQREDLMDLYLGKRI